MKARFFLLPLILFPNLAFSDIFNWTVDDVLSYVAKQPENFNMSQLRSSEGRQCLADSIEKINREDQDFQIELMGRPYNFGNDGETAQIIARYCGKGNSTQFYF